MKKLVKISLVAVTVVTAALISSSFYLLHTAIGGERFTQQEVLERLSAHAPLTRHWADSIIASGSLRDTTITMDDGTLRHAYYLPANTPTPNTAVLVHGYKMSGLWMLSIGYMYHNDFGYNILLPDLWCHGKSDGDYIAMGWNDRLDVLRWLDVANTIFKGDAPATNMVVHGVSMGAATVMNLSGEKTPDYVKCFIEDCGYTSVWDEFSHELHNLYHLPETPLLHCASALCKVRYGWSFGEASPLHQVTKATKPMMFIHGSNDNFVPTKMVYPLYKAYKGPKRIWVAPGSRHAMSYGDHPEEYTARVREFIAESTSPKVNLQFFASHMQ